MENYNIELDASGMRCPIPIIKASKALKGMDDGNILKLIATDIGTTKDIPAMCDQLNFELVSEEKTDDIYHYFIKK